MVNLDIRLESKPVETPDAECRIQSAWRLLAEMVYSMVEGERDNKEIPVELPQELDRLPSPANPIKVLDV